MTRARDLGNLGNGVGTNDIDNAAITRAKIGYSGAVLQVVQSVKSDTWSTVGTDFVEVAGFSATLSPTRATSAVMIDVCLHVGESEDAFPVFKLYRNGVELPSAPAIPPCASGMFGKTSTGANVRDQYLIQAVNFKWLDTPNTTSPVTYTVRVRPMGVTGGRFVFVNRSQTMADNNQYSVLSTLTLMEVAV